MRSPGYAPTDGVTPERRRTRSARQPRLDDVDVRPRPRSRPTAWSEQRRGHFVIESDSFAAPTVVVAAIASPSIQARRVIAISPAASSGFQHTAVRSATGGPSRWLSLAAVSLRKTRESRRTEDGRRAHRHDASRTPAGVREHTATVSEQADRARMRARTSCFRGATPSCGTERALPSSTGVGADDFGLKRGSECGQSRYGDVGRFAAT